jgi:hypothetical protein
MNVSGEQFWHTTLLLEDLLEVLSPCVQRGLFLLLIGGVLSLPEYRQPREGLSDSFRRRFCCWIVELVCLVIAFVERFFFF